MYMSIKTLDYVIFSHQANLSKTTKHWDGFVSHCSSVVRAFGICLEGPGFNPCSHSHRSFFEALTATNSCWYSSKWLYNNIQYGIEGPS